MRLQEDWEFNVLGVYNYRKPGMLHGYMDFIVENHRHLEGDILEAGVYRGRSLLAVGLLLKELGSDKQVYGYDTFSGFPPVYHEADQLERFDDQLAHGRISQDHHDQVQKNIRYRSLERPGGVSAENISLSGDFSRTSVDWVRDRIALLGLDNVHLVVGPFGETMVDDAEEPRSIMAALMDCDLYQSYGDALPFIWTRLCRGGYVALDEYYSLKFPGARQAVDEFFERREDAPQMHKRRPGDFERWFLRKLYGGSGT